MVPNINVSKLKFQFQSISLLKGRKYLEKVELDFAAVGESLGQNWRF
jgi:hypothetical protein